MTNSLQASELPVVILCGGQGTRLREETEHRPKPMVEIGGRPILWHIMKVYGAHGVRRFILCLGYKGWEIKQHFLRVNERRRDFTITLDGSREIEFHNHIADENWRVTLAETGDETATGGRLRLVKDYVDTQTFFMTYGDAVGNVDIVELLRFHREHGRIATVTGVRPTSRYGEIFADGSRVTQFQEKERSGEDLVSGGFFVLEREFFDYLDEDPLLFFEQNPLQQLTREGQLHVYVHEGAWYSMDTYRDYLQLNAIWNRGDAPWKVW